MTRCLNCAHSQAVHEHGICWDLEGDCDCPGFRDEPTDNEMRPRSRPVDSFEGHGDFNSSDPWERYEAHRAAKGY